MNIRGEQNRFDDFYKERQYVALKNDQYNYRLRKKAVTRYLRNAPGKRIIVEIGCGISPVGGQSSRTVFTDLSFNALRELKRFQGSGEYVVADGCHLPFKSGVFSYAVSSEVLEHIPDDRVAITEMARIVTRSGRLIITVPHRRCYFARDDRFVGHFRRYEIGAIAKELGRNGYRIEKIEKVLGPLEKVTMLAAVFIYERIQRGQTRENASVPVHLKFLFSKFFRLANSLFMGLVWVEARVLPMSFATVLMIVGKQTNIQPQKADMSDDNQYS